jgi:hypothetical protein
MMGFLDSLRRSVGVAPTEGLGPINPRLAGARGVEDEGDPASASEPEPFHGSEYDRKNWRKKLKLNVDALPDGRDRFREHLAEGLALGIEPETMVAWGREEFTMLVRRVVADRVVTEAEHRRLDMARELLDIPDPEAVAILQTVVADAERFFGGAVEGA